MPVQTVEYLSLSTHEDETALAADQQWVEVDLQTVLEDSRSAYFAAQLIGVSDGDYMPELMKRIFKAALQWQWSDLGKRTPQMRVLVRFDKENSED